MLATRIARARAAAGLSLRALANATGVSHTAVAKFEAGELTPASDTLLALARATGVRVEYFFRPDTVTLGQPEYRKRSRMGVKALAIVEAEILDQIERVIVLLGFFPEAPVPRFTVPNELPPVHAQDDIELIATALRRAWGLGDDPIGDLMGTLEQHGLWVFTTPGDPKGRFDGLAARVNNMPILVVGEAWPGDRQRFTLAHELGHLVLHQHLPEAVDEERACDRFAGAFLAPRPAVLTELGRTRHRLEARELYQLKHSYGLSMSLWVFRAQNVGVITPDTASTLHRTFGARGRRSVEPGDPYPSEVPTHVRRLVLRALAEDLIGESKAAELVGVPLSAFRQWRGLTEGARAPAHP